MDFEYFLVWLVEVLSYIDVSKCVTTVALIVS